LKGLAWKFNGTAVDPVGEVAASAAVAGAVHGSQRTIVDGRVAVQPVVPVVCRTDLDEPVWVATVFSKNWGRLLEGDIAERFFEGGDARLARKSGGHEAKLSYCGNVVIENRNGLVVDTELLRQMKVTPRVAQNDGRRGGSAIDERTTRHAGYKVSQQKQMRNRGTACQSPVFQYPAKLKSALPS
jgi:hypothetical protein